MSEAKTAALTPSTVTVIAGSDGTNVRALKLGSDGTLPATTTPNSTATAVTNGSTSVTGDTALIAANTTRKGVQVVNSGATGVFLSLGAVTAATSGAGAAIFLAPNGGAWDGYVTGYLWTGAVRAISASGTNVVTVAEV